jgi:hypothetical protein
MSTVNSAHSALQFFNRTYEKFVYGSPGNYTYVTITLPLTIGTSGTLLGNTGRYTAYPGALDFVSAGGSGTVVNNGAILGGTAPGVSIRDSNGISIANYGSISGTRFGVYIASGTNNAVGNGDGGTISGSQAGISNLFGTGLTVTNSGGGVISGTQAGISDLGPNPTIIDEGAITATSSAASFGYGIGYGVDLQAGGVIVVGA